jgi:hypothetical protein
MQRRVENSPGKVTFVIKSNRNKLFSKIFAIHAVKGFESLVSGGEFDKYSDLFIP